MRVGKYGIVGVRLCRGVDAGLVCVCLRYSCDAPCRFLSMNACVGENVWVFMLEWQCLGM